MRKTALLPSLQDPRVATWLRQHARAAAGHRQRFNEINQEREPALRAHLAQGGKLAVDLGCGDGYFGASLAERTQRWVLGIDASATNLFVSERFNLDSYAGAGRFFLLPNDFRYLLNIGLAGGWACLRNTVEQGFVIMPQAINLAQEGLKLWEALAVPRAELHVRTEMPRLIGALEFNSQAEKIAFDLSATDISSHHTAMSKHAGQDIFEQGFRSVS